MEVETRVKEVKLLIASRGKWGERCRIVKMPYLMKFLMPVIIPV